MFRHVRGERGSVSVFLLIIFIAIFFFNAVLIDYVRIAAAERQLQSAVHASVRSVLAAFDKELHNQYKLFGGNFTDAEAKAYMLEVLEKNLYAEIAKERTIFLDTTLDGQNFTFKSQGSLRDSELFRNQVTEEMKYKAPIEMSKVLLAKLAVLGEQGNANMIDNAQQVEGSAKEIMSLVKKREEILTDINKDFSNILETSYKDVYEYIDGLDPEEEYSSLAGGLDLSDLSKAFKEFTESTKGRVDTAKQLNAEIRELYNTLTTNGQEWFDESQDTNMYYKDNFFDKYYLAANSINSYYTKFKTLMDKQYTADEENKAEVIKGIIEDCKSLNSPKIVWAEPAERLSEEERKFKKQNKLGEEAAEKQTSDSQKAAKEKLTQFQNQLEKEKQLQGEFQELAKIAEDYGASTEPEKEADGWALLKTIFDLRGALEDGLHAAYFNEYLLMYFTYYTQKQAVGNKIGDEQVEYVLFGQNTPHLNHLLTFAEITAIRTAINFIDGLYLFKGLSPIAAVIAATAYSITMGTYDTYQLTQGQSVSIFGNFNPIGKYINSLNQKSGTKLELDYRDHLWIFLLMHFNQTNQTSRTQALVHLNTGIPLKDRPVYVEATASASIRLWFLPMVADALGKTGVLKGSVQGGRYYMKRTAAMSY